MNTASCEKEAPSLSRDEAIAILDTPDEELEALIDRASSLRYKYKGNRVSIHILTNARSGNCSQDCAYCAQSCRSTADIDKYKWVDEDKLYQDNDFVNEYHLSRHCIGLSGMKFTDKEIEELARRIRKMKEHGTHLCCSIGFLTEHQAKMLKEAGLDRINHNLNSSRSFYHNICSTHTFDQRVRNIHMLQGLGFEICSGGIIGMGESKADVVDMLLELREIQPEALPINFLLPIKGTPLGNAGSAPSVQIQFLRSDHRTGRTLHRPENRPGSQAAVWQSSGDFLQCEAQRSPRKRLALQKQSHRQKEYWKAGSEVS